MRTPRMAMTALMLVPAAAATEELEVGTRGAIYWTENAQGVTDEGLPEEDDDFSLRVTPSIAVRDPDGELTWSLRYQPSYERFLDQSEISGFDHAVAAALGWRISDQWTFTLTESYVLNQTAVRFNEAALPGQEVAFGFQDQEVQTNRTAASLSHALNPRDTLALTLSYFMIEYPDGFRSSRSTPSALLSYSRIFSERTTGGLTFSWTQQSNEGDREGNDETYFYNLSANVRYLFSPTFRVEASAGPTLVDSAPPSQFELPVFGARNIQLDLNPDPELEDVHGPFAVDADLCAFPVPDVPPDPNDPPPVPGRAGFDFAGCSFPLGPIVDGQLPTEITNQEFVRLFDFIEEVPTVDAAGNPVDDSGELDLTYFARLALVKDWEHLSGTIGYQRSNAETGRVGSSSVADLFWASVTWKPGELWTLGLSAAWSLYEQGADVAVPVALDLVNAPAPPGVTSVTEVAQIVGVVFGDSDFEYETQSVAFSATRRLSRRASAFATVNWYAQEQTSSLVPATSEGDNFSLSVGLSWTFDPIRF